VAQTPKITQTSLWDRIYLLSTASQEKRFFAVPFGQPDPDNTGAGAKQISDTNLGTAQRLNDPESFDCYSIQFILQSGTPEADADDIFNKAWLEFYTGGGQILSWQSPAKVVTAGMGYPASSASTVHAQNGFPSPGAIVMFKYPIVIGINENFYVSIKFGSALALAAARYVSLVLNGDHYMVDVIDPSTGQSTRRSAGSGGALMAAPKQ
jgi:hypothetical protein